MAHLLAVAETTRNEAVINFRLRPQILESAFNCRTAFEQQAPMFTELQPVVYSDP